MQSEKKTLYLGLDPSRYISSYQIVHYPLIEIVPRSFEHEEIQKAFQNFYLYSHLIVTSRSAAKLVKEYCSLAMNSMEDLKIIAVGKATASLFEKVDFIAKEETGEGILAILEGLLPLDKAHVFYPHAALARPLIKEFLLQNSIVHTDCILYDTLPFLPNPLPKLEEFEEIVFTSPSTVEAFIKFFGSLPHNITLKALGPITQKVLDKFLSSPMVVGTYPIVKDETYG